MIWIIIANEHFYPQPSTEDWLLCTTDHEEALEQFRIASADMVSLIRIDADGAHETEVWK